MFFWFSSSQILQMFLRNRQIYLVLACSQKMWKGLKSFLLSYLLYSQIWLNFLVDDHQFGYITKLNKTKACSQTVPLPRPAFVLGAKFRQNAKKIIGDIIVSQYSHLFLKFLPNFERKELFWKNSPQLDSDFRLIAFF